MSLQEIINQYGPWIATALAILGPTLPMFISKVISDKKMLRLFDNLKNEAKLGSTNQISIDKSLLTLSKATEKFQIVDELVDKTSEMINEMTVKLELVDTIKSEAERQSKNLLDVGIKLSELTNQVTHLKDAMVLVASNNKELAYLKEEISRLNTRLGVK